MDPSILEDKKLADLRVIAKTLGIKSITKYRKKELIDLFLREAKKGVKEETNEQNNQIIEIEDIDMDKLPEKVSEEIEQMDNINGAEGILDVHQDGYIFKM